MADQIFIEVQKHLGGVDHPAPGSGARDDVLEALRGLPDEEFAGPAAVSSSLGD